MMRLRALALALVIAALAAGGCGKCKASSDCDRGELCDFVSGECLAGCKSNADCSPNTRCDSEIGKCKPIDLPRDEDSGTRDTSTSTNADASVAD
jgi:hypothetical protein